jgi:hypothetical protein
VLKVIIRNDIDGLSLKPKEKEVLTLIGEKNGARAGNYKEYGLKTMQDFSGNYLSKMHRQNLLIRFQQGRAVIYKLRGVAALAAEYKLFVN